MPTYVFTTSKNRLTSEQKKSVVEIVTNAHAEATGAPRFVVQVIFNEIDAEQHYINGIPVSRDQVWVRADIRAGRTEAQTQDIINRITTFGSAATGIDATYFWVYICDITTMSEFGSVMPKPGGEGKWIASLPAEVKTRYKFDDPNTTWK
jgi:phenylpyruvate tautomerase PptA (4-oxalocrotonate tautomerase family)